MRLVIVGPAFPMRGGIAQSVAQLFQVLRDMGHICAVLSFKRLYPSIFFPGKTQTDDSRINVPVAAYPLLDSINPLSWIQALLWILSYKPDAIVFEHWMPFFSPCYATIAGLVKWMLNIDVLMICHNIVPHEKKIGDAFLSKLGLYFMDGFIVQSKSVGQDLQSFRPNAKVRYVPHPVYSHFPAAIPKAEAKKILNLQSHSIILYFGLVRAYKGLKYLIQAMPMILKKKSVYCLVCGEFYEGRQEIMDLISDSSIGNNVTIIDAYIPNEKVHHYFCAADLVVLPYVSATQSGVINIAYYYNRPVVVTNVGGLPEVVDEGRTGFLVPPKDPSALADAVIKFYNHKDSISFEKNIESEKGKYSWERMADALLSFMSAEAMS